MDLVCDHPFASPPMATSVSSSSSSSPSSSTAVGVVGIGSISVDVGSSNESLGRRRGSMVLESVEHVVSVVLTVIFAIVGSFAGAITGGLIGLATESGLFRGAGIGAISGAVFSIEVVESSLAIWHSHRSGIWSILFVLDTILSLLSGRLVREKIGPAVQNAVQSQMSAIDTPFQEILDIFETGGTKGMMRDAVEELPKMIITPENDSDASGERICCSVCLQDFQLGETVRNLPHCHHMFHLPCIDSWLMRHGSCPLCRRDF